MWWARRVAACWRRAVDWASIAIACAVHGVCMKGTDVGGVVFSPFLGVCDPYTIHGIHDVGADDTNRTVLERSSVTFSKSQGDPEMQASM